MEDCVVILYWSSDHRTTHCLHEEVDGKNKGSTIEDITSNNTQDKDSPKKLFIFSSMFLFMII